MEIKTNKLSGTKELPSMMVIPQIAALWIASNVGYYILFSKGYDAEPIRIALYYIFWLALTIFSFWNVYKGWKPVENRLSTYIIIGASIAGIVLYLTYLLPNFQPIVWAKAWQPPSELLFATPWYFLPKSIEILLQQFLVAAMVLTFSAHEMTIKETSIWSAILFGGAHLLLVFGGSGLIHTATFTIAAVAASFVFPYLILRVRNGFIYSNLLHWLFYAVTIVLARLVF
ncbi:MAG: hypothetical protein UW46_C0001G0086 [Candidatus Yanofskybacteria bacterium GW2011_GWF1_44_227]|uniref:CPBP family intramembrane metalloprotease n=1 Tax=Candidatus Yanofskybacteria bacterium GW2011_GWE2_40_11 TaxID=1619033 RepID=A0A0G0TTB2_9BACT|nr:MAG: hypothetical protein UT69_C0013G0016 [Candidatus Yanofskybacteria bacterium GW2011_GWE1_40_10]KKR41112.1 MAG: hypothetical protein UT75_C0001G0016 [Candidatus Yanofskybacteria bacterium GW2011_GWE2_40_11]KKT15890.1 MAG: hypothetical protein UV97_C0001G0063 [Candidatus Yanofskybacteria bacterium GW2011_GWF2_43_596]KKT53596.1 MAG: hypothetical protein UW46_C0001G0086 [Candidatus Yanofskybacteria bacterium GW2011_GWF1_44_227]